MTRPIMILMRGGIPLVTIKIEALDSEDCRIALDAAIVMAKRFKADMVIKQDLSIARADECDEPALEIIRFDQLTRDW